MKRNMNWYNRLKQRLIKTIAKLNQISRSEVISFESYCSDTHHRLIALPGPLKWSAIIWQPTGDGRTSTVDITPGCTQRSFHRWILKIAHNRVSYSNSSRSVEPLCCNDVSRHPDIDRCRQTDKQEKASSTDKPAWSYVEAPGSVKFDPITTLGSILFTLSCLLLCTVSEM